MKEHKNKIFFIEEENITNNESMISGSDYNHIVNVLRFNIGDSFQIQTEKGKYHANIKRIDKKTLTIYLNKFINFVYLIWKIH